jgi:hypothetical protein
MRRGDWGIGKYTKAFCSIILVDTEGDQVTINSFTVVDTGKGPFVGFPSKARIDKQGNPVKDIKTGKNKYDANNYFSELLDQRIKDAILSAFAGDQSVDQSADQSMEFPPKDTSAYEVTPALVKSGSLDDPDF